MTKDRAITILNHNRTRLDAFPIKALYLFGSVVRGEADAKSDVDILVEFEPEATVGLFQFARLHRTLTEILGCQVDLATPDSLHKMLKQQILEEAVRAA